jgi:catechol 2,3-dioxygenase-like lactoylglutathione lyase family enzyme
VPLVTTFTVDGLDHVHVAVRDRQAAAEWYGRVLGLVPAPEHAPWADDPQGPLFLATTSGAHCLALFRREPEPDNASAGDHTVAFRTAGAAFARFRDGLEGLGLRDRHGKRVGPGDVVDHGGAFSLYFSDPDGNRLELTTYEPVPLSGGAVAPGG